MSSADARGWTEAVGRVDRDSRRGWGSRRHHGIRLSGAARRGAIGCSGDQPSSSRALSPRACWSRAKAPSSPPESLLRLLDRLGRDLLGSGQRDLADRRVVTGDGQVVRAGRRPVEGRDVERRRGRRRGWWSSAGRRSPGTSSVAVVAARALQDHVDQAAAVSVHDARAR